MTISRIPQAVLDALPLQLGIPDLMRLMGCSRSTAYARTREPDFPTPIGYSGSSYRWWRHEVLSWVEAHRLTRRPTRAATPAARPVDAEELPAPKPVVRKTRRKQTEQSEAAACVPEGG